jgi:KEOPS complex subunit Cgi121
MSYAPASTDIRPASCIIPDRAAFLDQLRNIAKDHGSSIICFNADMLAGRAHATLAVELASRAFDEGTNISNTLEMEALLYAAGSRQCNVAASFGIREGENHLWVCCIPETENCWSSLGQLVQFNGQDLDLIDEEKQTRLMEIFSISKEELEAAGGPGRITDLVLERVALLQVVR